jgi:hypothetical protein
MSKKFGHYGGMNELRTTSEIINALGGNKAVAALLPDTQADAVSNWRNSRFPANTYVALKSALKHRGFCASDRLWNMKLPESTS